ncbi:hypothetical protein [Falsiroseomonas sp. HW251]|uniref:hypothetical protein n=1 Tax=Falsiroseomonas sp. HW251 TaxID=3390998 RepID=UPI003D315DE8
MGCGNGDEDTASLIDLSGPSATWRAVTTITVGQTPEGIQVSPDGRLVAVTVMNGSNKPDNSPFRGPGLVRTYRVEGQGPALRMVPAGEARVGTWAQGAAFSQDGRRLFVGNMVENNISVLAVGADGALSEGGPAIPLPGGSAAVRTAER